MVTLQPVTDLLLLCLFSDLPVFSDKDDHHGGDPWLWKDPAHQGGFCITVCLDNLTLITMRKMQPGSACMLR